MLISEIFFKNIKLCLTNINIYLINNKINHFVTFYKVPETHGRDIDPDPVVSASFWPPGSESVSMMWIRVAKNLSKSGETY